MRSKLSNLASYQIMTVAFKLLLILVKQSQIRARGAVSLPSLHTQLIFINQEGGFFLLFFFFKGNFKLSFAFSDTGCKIYGLSFSSAWRELCFSAALFITPACRDRPVGVPVAM